MTPLSDNIETLVTLITPSGADSWSMHSPSVYRRPGEPYVVLTTTDLLLYRRESDINTAGPYCILDRETCKNSFRLITDLFEKVRDHVAGRALDAAIDELRAAEVYAAERLRQWREGDE